MTNWKKVRITKIDRSNKRFIHISLNGGIPSPNGGGYWGIMFENRYPFTSYSVGEEIEIELDYCYRQNGGVYNNENIIKRIGSSSVVPSSSGSLTISTTPSSAAEVARTVTQTMMDQAERTGADVQCQIEQNTGNVNLFYRPKK